MEGCWRNGSVICLLSSRFEVRILVDSFVILHMFSLLLQKVVDKIYRNKFAQSFSSLYLETSADKYLVLFSRGNICIFFFLIIIGVNVLLSYQKFRNKCIYNVTLIFLNVVLTFTVKFQKTYLSFFFSLFLLLCLLYHVIFRSYLVGQNCLSRTFFSYLLIIVDIIIDTS